MKRINLRIDLVENEAFEKEVEEIIRAKARELARTEHSKMISEEVSNEIKRLTYGNAWGYRDKLKLMVKELTREELKRVVSDLEIKCIAEKCVDDQIDYIVSRVTNDVERKCKDVLDNTVNNAVQEKLKSILG